MDVLEIIVNGIFVLLLASILLWLVVYRRLDRGNPAGRAGSAWYRWHQLLVALIALLAILLAVLIVLSSDPGGPDLYLQGY